MGVVIDFWEWKRRRHTGKPVGKPVGGRLRRTDRRGNNGTAAPASIGDLSAELLRLLRE